MIRRACYDDIDAMAGLLSELFAIEDDFSIDIEKQSRGLKLLLDTPSAILLVVESKEGVIGMATLQTLISTAMGEKVGLIEDVIVSEAYRGTGIGKALLEALIAESEGAGLKRLALGADHRNHKAIAFYQKQRFSISNMGLMYRL
ncbi:MAG: GNAT family N-acetyltransferase [Sulfuricurvum sp.]|uniref:GNAT family N-acetyltransferase n=1 Tax=Sulfuricurvum sp. TaxID=2025608 RepID=UPI00271BFC99|nr:GNAT family N-acetyltransferase [Sulfuricurvum sp.]MDO9057054.1 GNAT family N-acetyltransferase [Sulfuricurvum sp.]